MSRHKRISPTIEQLITEEALRDRSRSRTLVAEDIRTRIEKMRERVPDEETLKKKISWARNHAPSEDEKPWSLGASAKHEIPIEAIPVVSELWRYKRPRGYPLTIRQAKWAAKLHTLFSVKDMSLLDFLCMTYALRERAQEVRGAECDTSDLDSILFMDRWELATALWTGIITEIGESPLEWAGTIPLKSDNNLNGLLAARDAERSVLVQLIPQQIDIVQPKQEELRQLFFQNELPDCFGTLGNADTAAWVYAYWITYLSHGPKWKSLPLSEQLQVIHGLREWIKNHPWSGQTSPLLAVGVLEQLNYLAINQLFKPVKLLRTVGYSPDVIDRQLLPLDTKKFLRPGKEKGNEAQ